MEWAKAMIMDNVSCKNDPESPPFPSFDVVQGGPAESNRSLNKRLAWPDVVHYPCFPSRCDAVTMCDM